MYVGSECIQKYVHELSQHENIFHPKACTSSEGGHDDLDRLMCDTYVDLPLILSDILWFNPARKLHFEG